MQLYLYNTTRPSGPNRPYELALTKAMIQMLCSIRFDFLKGVAGFVVLAHPHLLPLLGRHMLDEELLCMLGLEFPDVPWIPKLAGDAQVLATAHHGVGFAAFDCGGNAIWGEIIHLATSHGNKSVYGL